MPLNHDPFEVMYDSENDQISVITQNQDGNAASSCIESHSVESLNAVATPPDSSSNISPAFSLITMSDDAGKTV